MLRRALRDEPVIAAHGPLYEEDPAEQLLAPFRRTARETGWRLQDERWLAPQSVLDKAQDLRDRAAVAASSSLGFDHYVTDLVDWARAGLVLEIGRRYGIPVTGRGLLRPDWRLKGTVTGRFGCEAVRSEDGSDRWHFNPLSLGPDDRWRVHPSDAVRRIAVLDFKAMDLCSMVSLVPGLRERYQEGMQDMHSHTLRLLGGSWGDPGLRDAVKEQLFIHAYGGESVIRRELETSIPELDWLRALPHGEGARAVQARSALVFRAALSRVLPELTGFHHRPMFVVHDELVLDCSEIGCDLIRDVVGLLEAGAAARVGVQYRVGVSTGYTYEEAKHG